MSTPSLQHRGWHYDIVNKRLDVRNEGLEYMRFEDGNHTLLLTVSDTKNVRINSRNYTQTSGDASGVQIKPNQTVATAGITGLEVSPRYAAGIAGTNLVGIKCDPVLKGSGGGNLSGQVAGVQVNIDFGLSQTRTITGDVSAFEAFLAVPSNMTYSGDVSFLRVRTVNIKAWEYFLNLDDANTGVATSVDPSVAGTETRWLRVREASTDFWIKVFPAA